MFVYFLKIMGKNQENFQGQSPTEVEKKEQSGPPLSDPVRHGFVVALAFSSSSLRQSFSHRLLFPRRLRRRPVATTRGSGSRGKNQSFRAIKSAKPSILFLCFRFLFVCRFRAFFLFILFFSR